MPPNCAKIVTKHTHRVKQYFGGLRIILLILVDVFVTYLLLICLCPSRLETKAVTLTSLFFTVAKQIVHYLKMLWSCWYFIWIVAKQRGQDLQMLWGCCYVIWFVAKKRGPARQMVWKCWYFICSYKGDMISAKEIYDSSARPQTEKYVLFAASEKRRSWPAVCQTEVDLQSWYY